MTKTLIDPSKTYRTRHGWDVRNIRQHADMHSQDRVYELSAEVCRPTTNNWVDHTYTLFGEFFVDEISDFDLVEVEASEPPTQPATSAIRKDAAYHTRDGRQVRVLCTDALGTYPVTALVRNPAFLSFPEAEHMFMYTADGKKLHTAETWTPSTTIALRLSR